MKKSFVIIQSTDNKQGCKEDVLDCWRCCWLFDRQRQVESWSFFFVSKSIIRWRDDSHPASNLAHCPCPFLFVLFDVIRPNLFGSRWRRGRCFFVGSPVTFLRRHFSSRCWWLKNFTQICHTCRAFLLDARDGFAYVRLSRGPVTTQSTHLFTSQIGETTDFHLTRSLWRIFTFFWAFRTWSRSRTLSRRVRYRILLNLKPKRNWNTISFKDEAIFFFKIPVLVRQPLRMHHLNQMNRRNCRHCDLKVSQMRQLRRMAIAD